MAWRDGGRDFFLGEAKFLEEQQLSVTGKKAEASIPTLDSGLHHLRPPFEAVNFLYN